VFTAGEGRSSSPVVAKMQELAEGRQNAAAKCRSSLKAVKMPLQNAGAH